MINSKPRFALELEAGTLYDYRAGVYLLIEGVLEENGGSWDLKAVAALIAAGSGIEAAFTAGPTTAKVNVDKVEKAMEDFDTTLAPIIAAAAVAAVEPAPAAATVDASVAVDAAPAADAPTPPVDAPAVAEAVAEAPGDPAPAAEAASPEAAPVAADAPAEPPPP